jgi:hypothetical protein
MSSFSCCCQLRNVRLLRVLLLLLLLLGVAQQQHPALLKRLLLRHRAARLHAVWDPGCAATGAAAAADCQHAAAGI